MKTKLCLLDATIKSFYGFLCCFFFITTSLSAQISVSGKVVDAQNQPLVGASILEKGTSNGTLTDTEGAGNRVQIIKHF